jgi:hypothetical protein
MHTETAEKAAIRKEKAIKLLGSASGEAQDTTDTYREERNQDLPLRPPSGILPTRVLTAKESVQSFPQPKPTEREQELHEFHVLQEWNNPTCRLCRRP